jgi:hypothetical protein
MVQSAAWVRWLFVLTLGLFLSSDHPQPVLVAAAAPVKPVPDSNESARPAPAPEPGEGRTAFTADELKRFFPDLMRDFGQLKQDMPLSQDGLPDFRALAARSAEELVRLAGQLSRQSREQFRYLIYHRMKHFTRWEQLFGGQKIAESLLAALDAADQGTGA